MPPDRLKPLLAEAAARLRSAGCDTPDLDARLLLQWAAGVSREDLILEPDRLIGEAGAARFAAAVARRAAREPVSRIMGEREFYGRSFLVTPAVLDPRPDTETLVDAALAALKAMRPDARILDLGTGSGAIIVTLLAECPALTGMAVDLSPDALAVARSNARRLGVEPRLDLREGNWFAPVAGRFDLIVSNPPYIPDSEIGTLSPDVRNHDPHLALAGGTDGLDPYREIAAGAGAVLGPGGSVLVEIGAGQADAVSDLFAARGWTASGRCRDLAGHIRCLAFRRA